MKTFSKVFIAIIIGIALNVATVGIANAVIAFDVKPGTKVIIKVPPQTPKKLHGIEFPKS